MLSPNISANPFFQQKSVKIDNLGVVFAQQNHSSTKKVPDSLMVKHVIVNHYYIGSSPIQEESS